MFLLQGGCLVGGIIPKISKLHFVPRRANKKTRAKIEECAKYIEGLKRNFQAKDELISSLEHLLNISNRIFVGKTIKFLDVISCIYIFWQ